MGAWLQTTPLTDSHTKGACEWEEWWREDGGGRSVHAHTHTVQREEEEEAEKEKNGAVCGEPTQASVWWPPPCLYTHGDASGALSRPPGCKHVAINTRGAATPLACPPPRDLQTSASHRRSLECRRRQSDGLKLRVRACACVQPVNITRGDTENPIT